MEIEEIKEDYLKFCSELNLDVYSKKSVKSYITDAEIWYGTINGFYPQKGSVQELKEKEYFNNLKIALRKYTSYYKNKEHLRDEAIKFQMDSINNNYSYLELFNIQTKLEKQARKYGLVKEFKENCII